MSVERYRHLRGSVSTLTYHFVWCPKFRRKVLVGPVETALRRLIVAKVAELYCEIVALEVMPDHVHMFVECDPTRSVAEIVNRFKGRSSRILRQEFASLRTRLPTLWSRSYYAGSVGAVSEGVVRRYIEAQKGA